MKIEHKFDNMIETFDNDFQLAVQNPAKYPLSFFDDKIKEHDRRLAHDILLLNELAYLIRRGRVCIIVNDEEKNDKECIEYENTDNNTCNS